MGGGFPEVDLSGGGAAQGLMRAVAGVVIKPELKPLAQVGQEERLEGSQCEFVFEGSPESFDQGDRAGFADGAEAVRNGELCEQLAEDAGGELRALVGDEVARAAEPRRGLGEEGGDGGGSRLAGEKGGGQGHSGEDIVDDCELEGEQGNRLRISVRSAIQTWLGHLAFRNCRALPGALAAD